jgi:hypothetical protein
MEHFDLDKYLNANSDVFDQLEDTIQFNTKSRRFSLSIDDGYNTDYDEEIAFLTNTPSTTPEFEVAQLDNSLCYDPDLVEDKLIQDIPKSQLLISSKTDISFHKIPKNKGCAAYKIWNEAGIPELETLHRIESSLLDWADKSAELEISDGKITKIKWKSCSGYDFQSSWTAFIKWILCASMCE